MIEKVKLPLIIDALRAAQKSLDYVGFYPKEVATRIAGSVVSVDSDIDTELSFTVDHQHLAVINGQSKVFVTLECQRCGQYFKHAVHVIYCFSPVRRDKPEEALPEGYEAIELDEMGEVNLLAMIEDEIILSLPIIPIHKMEQCEAASLSTTFGELPTDVEKINPFAVLATLKKK